MALKIKADFQSKEDIHAQLHGCWIDVDAPGSPLGRFNKGGKKDDSGHFSIPYSERHIGICKSKECNKKDITKDQYCESCEKGSVTCCMYVLDACIGCM